MGDCMGMREREMNPTTPTGRRVWALNVHCQGTLRAVVSVSIVKKIARKRARLYLCRLSLCARLQKTKTRNSAFSKKI